MENPTLDPNNIALKKLAVQDSKLDKEHAQFNKRCLYYLIKFSMPCLDIKMCRCWIFANTKAIRTDACYSGGNMMSAE